MTSLLESPYHLVGGAIPVLFDNENRHITFLPIPDAWKSTRIVRHSGSFDVTIRPPSCWSRAPLGVWLPGSGNGIFRPGYVIGQACSCAPLSRSKYSAPACLLVDDTELNVTPMIHGSTP